MLSNKNNEFYFIGIRKYCLVIIKNLDLSKCLCFYTNKKIKILQILIDDKLIPLGYKYSN